MAVGKFDGPVPAEESEAARVIYFNAPDQTIWLLIVYTKAKFDNLPNEFLAKLKQGVEDAL